MFYVNDQLIPCRFGMRNFQQASVVVCCLFVVFFVLFVCLFFNFSPKAYTEGTHSKHMHLATYLYPKYSDRQASENSADPN